MLAHHRRRRRGLLLVLLSLLFFAFFLIRAFESHISDFSYGYIPNSAQRTATKAVCMAVEDYLSANPVSYGDLARINCGENGSVTSVETDSAKINLLKAEITEAAQTEMEKIKTSTAKIPLGAFTKLSLLSNWGPDINLNYSLMGSVSSEIESSFESAGINQTVHHLRLVVTVKVITASLDYRGEMSFKTDFELAQSVIVGKAPDITGGYLCSKP